jgi:hypothetical protein
MPCGSVAFWFLPHPRRCGSQDLGPLRLMISAPPCNPNRQCADRNRGAEEFRLGGGVWMEMWLATDPRPRTLWLRTRTRYRESLRCRRLCLRNSSRQFPSAFGWRCRWFQDELSLIDETKWTSSAPARSATLPPPECDAPPRCRPNVAPP